MDFCDIVINLNKECLVNLVGKDSNEAKKIIKLSPSIPAVMELKTMKPKNV